MLVRPILAATLAVAFAMPARAACPAGPTFDGCVNAELERLEGLLFAGRDYVVTLQRRVAVLEAELATVQADYLTSSSLDTYATTASVSALDTWLTDVESDATAAAALADELDVRVATVEGDYATGVALTAVDVRLGVVESDYASQLTEMDARVSTVEDDYATATAHDALETRVGTLEAADTSGDGLEDVEVRLAAIEADYVVTSAMDAIDLRVVQIEGAYASTVDLDLLDLRVSDIELDYAQYAEFESLEQQVLDIELNYATGDDVDDLDVRLNEIEGEYATSADLDHIEGRMTDFESDYATSNDLEDVEDRLNDLEDDYTPLDQFDDLDERLDDLEDDYASTRDFDDLDERLSDVESDYATSSELDDVGCSVSSEAGYLSISCNDGTSAYWVCQADAHTVEDCTGGGDYDGADCSAVHDGEIAFTENGWSIDSGNLDEGWLRFDLGGKVSVGSLRYVTDWHNMAPDTFEVWTSDDASLDPSNGATFVYAGNGATPPYFSSLTYGWQEFHFAEQSGRYWYLHVTDTFDSDNWLQMLEVEFAPPCVAEAP